MPDLQFTFKRQLKYILYIIAIYVLGWGFTGYQTIFAGLILGTAISTFNVWLLMKKSQQVGASAAGGKPSRSIGTASRYAAAVLAVIIALEYPQYINIYTTVLGLVTANVVIVIDYFIHKSNVNNGEER